MTMERLRDSRQRKQSYGSLDNDSGFGESESRPLTLSDEDEDGHGVHPDDAEEADTFSWITYAVFFLLGMAMLWAW